MTYFAQLATATLMLLSLSAPGALSAETEKMKLRPKPNKLRGAVYLESDAHAHEYETSSTSAVKILQDDMDALAEAFCGAAVAISDAFWTNGGKHHSKDDAYPQAACDAAYEQATAALNGAYNYPDPVLFKPTLSSAPYTFRPTMEGALSYFIGTECLLKSGSAEEQFPPGNDGTSFREYGFALANYRRDYSGFSGCSWVGDSYVEGVNAGVAQGQIVFERSEGTTSVVDKTFSFGVCAHSGNIVMTGHHSSGEVETDSLETTQYV